MPATVAGYRAGRIPHSKSSAVHTLQKVHVFEPDWIESLVEPADRLPGLPPDHQERTCRLFHIRGRVQIHVQTAIASVHRIAAPDAVQPQRFEAESQGRGESPDREASLRPAFAAGEFACRRAHARIAAGRRQFLEPGLQDRVRIQQENVRCTEGLDAR